MSDFPIAKFVSITSENTVEESATTVILSPLTNQGQVDSGWLRKVDEEIIKAGEKAGRKNGKTETDLWLVAVREKAEELSLQGKGDLLVEE